MGKMKDALARLAKKITGKDLENTDSISNIIDEMGEGYDGASTGYVNDKINEALQSVYTFKGSVDTYSELPDEDLSVGDVYNVVDTGNNYAWDGEAWDNLGGFIVPNPTLAGTEANLEGIQIGATKYKVSGGGSTFETLWTNPDTTQDFNAQTINIDVSGYEFLLFEFIENKFMTNNGPMYSVIVKPYEWGKCIVENGGKISYRPFVYNSNNELVMNAGYMIDTYGQSPSSGNLSIVIPVRIVGIK